MRSPSLEQYLADARAVLDSGSIDLLVTGNEAADLDSMVSAIAVARAVSAGEPDRNVVPLIPVPRGDFRLRTEAVCLFARAGIDPDLPVFLDDLPPSILPGGLTHIALVDHNRLSPPFSACGEKVDIIVDHHPDQGLYPRARTRIIEPVGSCATLAAEMLLKTEPGGLDDRTAMLLAGAILLDTVNLDPGAGRVSPKDQKMAAMLISRLGLGQSAFYDTLRHARVDTSGLTASDLLRRDFKTGTAGSLSWGIASIPLSVADWIRRDPDLCRAAERHAAAADLDILMTMHAYTDQAFRRELGIFCPDPDIHERITRFLTARPLGLAPLPAGDHLPPSQGRLSFYSQANVTMSRKKLIPILDLLAHDPELK